MLWRAGHELEARVHVGCAPFLVCGARREGSWPSGRDLPRDELEGTEHGELCQADGLERFSEEGRGVCRLEGGYEEGDEHLAECRADHED